MFLDHDRNDVVSKPVVFVVDDEQPYTDIMQDVLQDYGLEVHVAHSALDAMELLGWMTPDLIMLDIMMPNVDGITLLKHLRSSEDKARIPIVVSTAYPETEDDALAAGADLYLPKPFSAQDLRSAIGQFLSIKQAD